MKEPNVQADSQSIGASGEGTNRAIFADRDGTLNFERPDHVKSPEELVVIPGACEQISQIAQGFPYIIIITNQAVIGRGIISEDMLKKINTKMEEEFKIRTGRRIDYTFYCPHTPADNCDCRKPKTELFIKASHMFHLSLPDCVYVGDKDTDQEAAKKIGCRFIRVKTNTPEVLGKISA
jgi:histidinol-phosphate phosphatase family protein